MRSKPRRNRKTKRTRKNSSMDYGALEDRRVLAAIGGFTAGTNTFSITFENGTDNAIVDVVGGQVTLNGSADVDPNTAGSQTVDMATVDVISVTGVGTSHDVTFNGNFTGPEGDGGGGLQSIDITDVNEVTFNGSYETFADVDITLNGTGGSVNDGTTGFVDFNGITTINAGDNPIVMDNITHDFTAGLSAFTSMDAAFGDATGIKLFDTDVGGDLTFDVGTRLFDADGANINVDGTLRVKAGSFVLLGDNEGDGGVADNNTTNFFRMGFDVVGSVSVQEDSTSILINSDIGNNLTLNSDDGAGGGAIFDGPFSTINVTNNADLTGPNRIRLGDNGSDVFNSGTLTFNSNGHVHISANSRMVFLNESTALNAHFLAEGDIIDGVNASVEVTNILNLEALNIDLGDTGTDNLEAGAFFFFASNDASIDADSNIHIVKESNSATNLTLKSALGITDQADARINVAEVSTLEGTGIVLGEQAGDQFNSGFVNVNSTGNVVIVEDSTLQLTGTSVVNSLTLESINGNVLDNDAGADTTVTTTLTAKGALINLGLSDNDGIRFAALNVNSTGNTNVETDTTDAFVLTGSSDVGDQLFLTTGNNIVDGASSKLKVQTFATFVANRVTINDCFEVIAGTTDAEKYLLTTVDGTSSALLTPGCFAA